MKRIFILLLLTFSLLVGTSEAFADRHNPGAPRQEQRGKKNHHKHKGNKHRPGKGSLPAPGTNGFYAPVMPPPPVRPGTPVPPPPPPAPLPGMLQQMVINATYGCHDVNVWQVNPESFIIKYKRGKRLYTRMIYPYAGRYGNETLINVNWQPLNPWTLIPPIQLNINL